MICIRTSSAPVCACGAPCCQRIRGGRGITCGSEACKRKAQGKSREQFQAMQRASVIAAQSVSSAVLDYQQAMSVRVR